MKWPSARARILVLALLALLLLLAFVVVPWRGMLHSPATSAEPQDESQPRPARYSATPLPRQPVPWLSWLLQEGIEGERIAGKVISGGQPVVGAQVQLRSEYFEFAEIPVPTRTSDAAGRFDFGVQPATSYAVMASAESYQSAGKAIDLRDPEDAKDAANIVVDLPICSSWVHGEVRDAYGGLVIDGKISVRAIMGLSWFEELFSIPLKDDGTFGLCRPGRRQILWVEAEGYGTTTLDKSMPPGGWKIKLFPGGSVEGRLVGPDQEAVAGARVVLAPADFLANEFRAPSAQTVMSSEDGSFAFTGIAPGRYNLAADHGSYYSDPSSYPTVTVVPGEASSDSVLKMSRCRKIAGRVLLDGRPVAGATIETQVTQSDGRFLVSCTELEQFELEVRGYKTLNPLVEEGTTDIEGFEVKVEALAGISGVVTADGSPVPEAVVSLRRPERQAQLLPKRWRKQALTDQDGKFRLTGIKAGTHKLYAWDPNSGRRSGARAIRVADQGPIGGVELKLSNAGQVKGSVVDREQAPLPNLVVRLNSTQSEVAGKRRFQAMSDEDGVFRFSGIPAGSYQACVGYCSAQQPDSRYAPPEGGHWPIVKIGDASESHEIQLVVGNLLGLSISGKVRYSSGEPVPYAVLRTRDHSARTSADEFGAFELRGLSEGNYELIARAQDGSRAVLDKVAAGDTRVEILVSRTGTVQGRVEGGDSPCTVQLRSAGYHGAGHVSNGVREFQFTSVQAGPYVAEATCKEGIASKEVEVSAGSVSELVLTLVGAGTIEVRVREFPGGEDATGVYCSVGKASGTSNSEARLSLTPIFAGDHVVRCGGTQALGAARGHVEVSLVSGQTESAEVYVAHALALAAKSSPRKRLGATLRTTPERPHTEVFVDIVTGGPADKAGIREGDRLVSIAGTKATGSMGGAARFYLETRAPEQNVSLMVRQGEVLRQINLVMGSN